MYKRQAATNIAESVGSFFGSNKVKTLERENKNLHERVSELQDVYKRQATETIEPIADNDTTPKTTKQTKKILLFIR